MIIGVDGNEANIASRVGVNVYAFELLRSIYELAKEWKGDHKFVIYLKDAPRSDMPRQTAWWSYKVIPGGGLWIIKKLMPALFMKNERPDLFFTLNHYVPPFAPMPRMCSVMDLGYLESSEHFRKKDYWQLKLWTAWSIMLSKKVFAISQSTRQDVIRHYPNATGKVVVTHLGYDKEKFNTRVSDQVKAKYGIKREYILFISTLKPSKNVSGLLKAFKLLSDDFPAYSLVLAGKKGWMYDDIFAEIKALNITKRVIFTDYIPEEDKPGLITGARVFVLPSFWEGFGIDALNAMACGVPVVVSNSGSLPEVVGDAGILVDPHKIESIADGIRKVLSADKIEYNRIVKKGLTQAENFSWEKCARETLKGLGVL